MNTKIWLEELSFGSNFGNLRAIWSSQKPGLEAFSSSYLSKLSMTDFSKAFERFSHSLILFKLSALKFSTVFVNLIEPYLTYKTYVVRCRFLFSLRMFRCAARQSSGIAIVNSKEVLAEIAEINIEY